MSLFYSNENYIKDNEAGVYFVDADFNCFEGPEKLWLFLNNKKVQNGTVCYYHFKQMICVRINNTDFIESYIKVLNICRKEKISNIVCPVPSYAFQKIKEIRCGIEDFIDDLNVRMIINNENLISLNINNNRLISGYLKTSSPTIKSEKKNTEQGLQFSKGITLDDLLKKKLESINDNMAPKFRTQLFNLIDKKKMLDTEVYKRANIDKRLFSKIRCDSDYMPSKDTVIALCVALKLNINESNALLNSIGASFSSSLLRDVILKACIEAQIYDIDEINLLLLEKGMKMLGNYK